MATTIFVVSGTSQTSPADWDNAANTVEGIGGGGSGGAGRGNSSDRDAGGGGGEYRKISNFAVATPGTTAFNYVIGAGGTAKTQAATGRQNGSAGANTTFNVTDLIAVAGGGGQGGTAGGGATVGAGGTGGTGAAANFDGGAGGATTTGSSAGGGGGAAGPNGAGVSAGTAATNNVTAGGNGDNGSGGAGGAGDNAVTGTAQDGAAGTEWDATHGSGGGGGAARSTAAATNAQAGNGGLYGAGGGAALRTSTSDSAISGSGAQGIIVIIYTPTGGGGGSPFTVFGFSNPVRTIWRPAAFLAALPINLIGLDQFFGAPGEPPNYRWPAPKRPGQPIDRRGPVTPLNINLIGQDKFYGAPGQPPPAMRWNTPVRRPPVRQQQAFVRFLGLSSSLINLIYVNSTTWQTPTPYYKAGGSWTVPTAVYVNKAGVWSQVYG